MICPATGFRLGSVIAECQGQDSAPRQLVGLAKRSHRTLLEPPLTHEIVVIAQQLPQPPRDPADRFLAATAQVLDLRWLRRTTVCFA